MKAVVSDAAAKTLIDPVTAAVVVLGFVDAGDADGLDEHAARTAESPAARATSRRERWFLKGGSP